jgi:heavy metal sensor kinase
MIFPRSIRWRLLSWLAFLLVLILAGFGVTAYQLQRMSRLRQIDDDLEKRVAALTADISGIVQMSRRMDREPGRTPPDGPPLNDPGDRPSFREPPPDGGPGGPGRGGFRRDLRLDNRGPGRPPWDDPESRPIELSGHTLGLFDQTDPNAFYFAAWGRSGRLMKSSTNAPASLAYPAHSRNELGLHVDQRGDFREMARFTEIGERVLAGRNIAPDLAAMNRFAGWLVLAGGAILAFGLGGAWWVTGSALRPVKDIGTTASRISGGNLSERIDLADTDGELGHLAGVLNSTFARLETAFAQQQQFTADASHELRTPLAVLISETQTTLARARSPEEYRETVEACLETAQQMRRLTESLLQLARFDAGQETMRREPIDLADIARACADRIRPLAEERGLKVVCDLAAAPVSADSDRLAQVINNLLVNAIHHTGTSGEIRVRTGVDGPRSLLAVSDTGTGVPPDQLPHIFKRFYRADPSRGRAEGRSGLGLAISLAIVEAHGGTLEATSEPGRGSVFSACLPRDVASVSRNSD